MAHIIKNRRLVEDAWQRLILAEGETADTVALPPGPLLLPLPVWQARRAELADRAAAGEIGVWLAAGEDPEALAPDLDRLALVAMDFPKFTDGRGYSSARLIRERYGYQGEIRAVGDVLPDQLFYMSRCGIDAFALKEGRNPDTALALLDTFHDAYQTGTDRPVPLFRRR